ncbi:MAG: chromosome segregation ATPase [Acidimicrobiales bacterium]
MKAMPGQPAEHEETGELRAQLVEYERIFSAAAPRLAAFKRLEEIARERKTAPEAVAAEAAMEVLRREHRELDQLSTQYRQKSEELERDVATLTETKKNAIQVLDDLRIEHNDIHQEVGEILGELNLLRDDAVRLMSERRELELHVRALKLELAHLEKRRVEMPDDAGAVAGAGTRRQSDPVPGKHDGIEFSLAQDAEAEESELFDKFFHAKVEHDKARDWILS